MAIGHLSVRVGKVGKAQPHAAYIARQGQYTYCQKQGERLEHTEVGNMPAWAQHDPLQFWQVADQFERANGSTYREYEIALPRELNQSQRLNLVHDFVKQELGHQFTYQFAIHNPKAADGQEQPHCHLMFCERELDGITRDPEQFFKRYNAKHPERGGAKKTNTGKDYATRQQDIKDLRKRWEVLCNAHLEQVGSKSRIDMRSYRDRGSEQEPEPKQHPKRWKDPQQRAVVLEFRAAQREQVQAQHALKSEIKDLKADLIELKKAKKIQAQLERVFTGLLQEAQRTLHSQKEEAHTRLEQAEQNLKHWQTLQPQAPTGLLAFLKHKDYQQDFNAWQQTYTELEQTHANAQTESEKKRPTVEALAQQNLERYYPELANEKKRLERLQQREEWKVQRAKEKEQAEKQAKAQAEQLAQAQAEKRAKEQAKQEKQAQLVAYRKACADLLRSQDLEAISKRPELQEIQRKIEQEVRFGRERQMVADKAAGRIETGFTRLDPVGQGKHRGMER
ncbi:MobA/MobL family protein [Thiofilum flexile]|uniref:MobA/MobL family protein n=1 Tax=Thiofilum flexile TaxID=125627 RepID=UPI0003679732|nr:MobA/MobL family protein [Thiofilum flexile]